MNLLSGQLRNFKQRSDRLYNFSCPFCGDSEKNKKKARGYLYETKNIAEYKCHNCDQWHTFPHFLKALDFALYTEYTKEKWIQDGKPQSNSFAPEKVIKDARIDELVPISRLDNTHYAKRYLINRKIPEKMFDELYYVPNFRAYTNSIIPDKFKHLDHDEDRIIIPFLSREKRYFGFQGRSLRPPTKGKEIRYISIIFDERYPKLYGLHKLDIQRPFLVFEGPFDSMFFDNAIASCGADLVSVIYQLNINRDNLTMVFDNEPRNKDICRLMYRTIDKGLKICIWPDTIEQKDVNDMILKGGYTSSELQIIIEKYTYFGLSAKAKLSQWRKCD